MKKLSIYTLLLLTVSISFSQNISSPSDFLGYEIGSQFSRHHERRPLYVTYVSSPENINKLETIRTNNLKNAGILQGNSPSNDIGIVWLSYNVHGNEASSTEAAMLTLYQITY